MAVQVPPNCDLTLGMVCVGKPEPGITIWKMDAEERFANPAGVVQGGFLAAFADSAMGASTVTKVKGRKVHTANAEMKISYFKPAKIGQPIFCKAIVVAGGSRVLFVEATVETEQGETLAKASSTYILTERQ